VNGRRIAKILITRRDEDERPAEPAEANAE
jgi:hypothetical protein